MGQILLILALCLLCTLVSAEFTADFRSFLDQKYGKKTRSRLERIDQGRLYMGSFGGRMDKHQPVHNRPVIFIHGTISKAGFFLSHRKYFMEHGYSSGELYATTYGDGGIQPMWIKTMDCSDVENIRDFIIAVSEYTNSKVDVIAFSMGVAISRKALLGGQCQDTNKDLGEPITDIVNTYLAVGGLAYGMENCPPVWPACSNVNGMACNSQFLRDVNSQSKSYEAATTYAIYSRDDPIIGQHCCGHLCSDLKNANLTVVRSGLDHAGIIFGTVDLQYQLIRYQKAEGI